MNIKNDEAKRIHFSEFGGGPEKGRLVFKRQDERRFKPWRACRSSWAARRPGCWVGHRLERW